MKHLVLISGPPGVGKSTLSRRLAQDLSLVLIDKDLIDEAFSPGDRGENYTKFIEAKVIAAMLNLADENLKNFSVILDAPWTHILLQKPYLHQEIDQIAKQNHAEVRVIELHLSEQDLFVRIKARNLDRDHVKLSKEGWRQFKESDEIEKRIDRDHFAIDASLDKEEVYRLAKDYLTAHP